MMAIAQPSLLSTNVQSFQALKHENGWEAVCPKHGGGGGEDEVLSCQDKGGGWQYY